MYLKNWDLYFITDSELSKKTILNDISSALSAGVKVIQLRDKKLTDKEFFALAEKAKKLCKKKKADLIINDRVHIALAVNADGVHLGQNELPLLKARKILPGKIIGVTVHNEKEAIKAQKEGADYLGVSPIYKTTTKLDAGKPVGLNLLLKIRKKVTLPLVAIGGIHHLHLKEVLFAGADSAAMISAIVGKRSVLKECKKAIEMINEYRLKNK